MSDAYNALRWDGSPGHYEVWFITLTDGASGTGVWIRFALHAPDHAPADCSLWFLVMRPDGTRFAARERLGAELLREEGGPTRLVIADCELSARGSAGAFGEVRWELRWDPAPAPGLPVHPAIERLRLAKTMFVIPQPSVAIEGTVAFGGQSLELSGAHGAQAHLWGSKHADSWGWAHAAELETLDGEPRPGDWIDGISIIARRMGRSVGPSTSVVGRLLGEEFQATAPLSVLRARSTSGLSRYRAETRAGNRRVLFEVDAPLGTLVGVTYDDPDGERLRCWNTEVASMRLWVWDRARRRGSPWLLRETLQAPGRACFEYAQREPLTNVEMHLT
ncbi:MAG TPA: hypothetical protein VMT10_00310 [Solirubrobacteraceae bacterium]|nr:hypothetical protein [Solirubrobacteraceae bacterium]